MNTLLINLARFGDLLQSQAVLADLAAAGHNVGLVCLDNFRHAAAMLRHVHSLFPLPGGTLLTELERDWPRAVMRLDAWSRTLHSDFQPTRVLNLTPTLAARLLGRFVAETGGDDSLPLDGFGLDKSGFGRNGNAWAAFFQGASRVRGVSPFNMVDMFRKVAGGSGGLPDPDLARPTSAALERVRHLLALEGGDVANGFVVLQAGASEDRRRWPAEYFAALGDSLWREEGCCPVLLGSAGEKELVASVAAAMHAPHVVLAGRTSLGELGAVLTICRLLVSNDTGTLHLAAGLNVPTLGIFLATAQPWDTGPYRAHSCSLEPDISCHPCAFDRECHVGEVCRRTVLPETVAGLARHFLHTGSWRNAPSYAGVRAWESVADEDGLMNLISLSGHDGKDRTLWLREQRWFYRQFLDRDPGAPFVPELPKALLALSQAAAKALEQELGTALSLLDAIMQQGQLLMQRPLPQIKERFLASCSRLDALLRESSRLAALSLLWLDDASGSGDLPLVLCLAGQYHSLLACLLRRVSSLQ